MKKRPVNSCITRRAFLRHGTLLPLAVALPARLTCAQETLPRRAIPGSGESLPVIGLGSSKAVMQLASAGTRDFARVLRTLLDAGGRVVDTWSRDAALDALAGQAMQTDRMVDELFLATKVDADGAEAGREMITRTERLFGKIPDLIQVFSMRDAASHWPVLRQLKQDGRTRYIGITVATESRHADMMQFMRRERPDFIQVNYSPLETGAGQALLPLAADLGVAVLINRPFINGEYFPRLQGKQLPEWAADFDCRSWAQFSLKYILANPAVTCVLTETTSPEHLLDNIGAAYGRLPDAPTRRRMQEFMQSI